MGVAFLPFQLLWTESCAPPKFICWSPNPGVTVFGDEVSKETVKVKWGYGRKGTNLIGLVFLRKRDSRGAGHRGKAMWGHCKKVVACKPRREAAGEIRPARTLILDFQLPELWEDKRPLFKPPSPWYFVTIASADYNCNWGWKVEVDKPSLASELPNFSNREPWRFVLFVDLLKAYQTPWFNLPLFSFFQYIKITNLLWLLSMC